MPGRPASWLGLLPEPLFRAERAGRYVLLAWALAFFPSLLLASAVAWLLPGAASPDFPARSLAVMALIVVASPIVESLLMGAALDLLRRWLDPALAVLLSAIGWGLVHSLAVPGWGLVVWWPFLIFSIAFVTWRGAGFWPAAGLAAAVHALHNLPVALLLAAGLD